MLSRAFIGGALAGMAGLAAATFIDHKITESKFSPELKTPESLDVDAVVRELNNYFFKAQAIIAKCNEIVIRSSEHIVTPVPLPWDNPLQKAANAIGGGLTKICRCGSVGQLKDRKEEAEKLYARYLGVFERADAILKDRGRTPVSIKRKLFDSKKDEVNNSLENEDWDSDFDRLADEIRDGIEQSCQQAEQLIEILGQTSPVCALEAAQS